MSLVRRLRYEVASRLNRLGAQRDYRWTSARKGNRISIILRDSKGRERELLLRENGSDYPVFLQIFDQLQYATDQLARAKDIQARYDAIINAAKPKRQSAM